MIALVRAVFRGDARLRFGDIAPRLVQFDSDHIQVAHKPIIERGAALAGTDIEQENSAPINAGSTFGSADADTLGEDGDSFDLLFTGKNVHDAWSLS
ncbi:MAG: hypothetical protein WBG11_05580 [Methylocella sp.]